MREINRYDERELSLPTPPPRFRRPRPYTITESLVEGLNESHETIRIALALADVLGATT